MSDSASENMPSELEWQQLWFGLRARPWSTLAVVGIESAELAVDAAMRLAHIGRRDEQATVEVIPALGMPFEATIALARKCQSESPTSLTLVACDSPVRNAAALPLLQAVSGVVIVVAIGARLDQVRRALELVGRDKVVATVSVG